MKNILGVLLVATYPPSFWRANSGHARSQSLFRSFVGGGIHRASNVGSALPALAKIRNASDQNYRSVKTTQTMQGIGTNFRPGTDSSLTAQAKFDRFITELSLIFGSSLLKKDGHDCDYRIRPSVEQTRDFAVSCQVPSARCQVPTAKSLTNNKALQVMVTTSSAAVG